MTTARGNIILIGMAGAGKSTVGRLLAKKLNVDFVDTDDLIAEAAGLSLPEILRQQGKEALQRLEEQVLLSLDSGQHVIATGGSAVYSEAGMTHLAEIGVIIYLDVDITTLEERVQSSNLKGLVNPEGSTFRDLAKARQPLYKRFAERVLSCSQDTAETLVDRIVALLGNDRR